MVELKDWIEKYQSVHAQMLEDHYKINMIFNDLFREIRKPHGNVTDLLKRLLGLIKKFENVYELSYCFDITLMFE